MRQHCDLKYYLSPGAAVEELALQKPSCKLTLEMIGVFRKVIKVD